MKNGFFKNLYLKDLKKKDLFYSAEKDLQRVDLSRAVRSLLRKGWGRDLSFSAFKTN
jgi:hypothetical protein